MSVADTGRLTVGLGKRTARQVFGEPDLGELWLITKVDLAHVVMLTAQDLIDRESAARLLARIESLRADGFESLRGLPMPRGLYLAYEHHLIGELGEDVGGRLHTGRSRNDLNATTTAMKLRGFVLDLLDECVRLVAVQLNRARADRDTVMSVYTHFQAAMPMTYGHYLTGIALALIRDMAAVRFALDGLRRCPMGACAVAGTDLPIDPSRTAALLGFDEPPVHSIDMVASRDAALRIVAAFGGLGVTLSRLATDLQLWSTSEFGFVEFAERLVGGSSAMPQKRNAFLLEHVKAKAAAVLGAWTTAASAMKSTPFTNTIEVGTEAMRGCWPGLHAVADAVSLCQVLVSGARPRPDRMAQRAATGYVTATASANQLVRQGVPFRTAHHMVGAAVRRAVELDTTELTGLPTSGKSLADVVAAQRHGGGPGAFDPAFALARRQLEMLWRSGQADRARLMAADEDLADSVRAIISSRGELR